MLAHELSHALVGRWSRLMITEFETLAPETSVQALIDEHLLRSEQRAFPVVESERLVLLTLPPPPADQHRP